MQARGLGGALDASSLIPSALFRRYNHCTSISILLFPTHARCFARTSNSHVSLKQSHVLMTTNMSEPRMSHLITHTPTTRRRVRRYVPTEMEVMEARLNLLTTLIAANEGKKDLSSAQIARHRKHTLEKTQLEIKIGTYNYNTQTFAQAAAAIPQPPTSESNNIPIANSTRPMELRPANVPAAHIKAEMTTARDSSIHELPARSSFSAINRPIQQSVTQQGLQMTLPLRPVKSKKRDGDKDPIVPPSAASGGVPEPSPMYLSLSKNEPQDTSTPQHLLLVIDLNGTLLHRPDRNRPFHFIERPSTQQFLKYALADFSVMIWSSARPGNVDRMCEKLFSKESRQKLLAVWGRDRLGLSAADSNKRVQVYKRLERVWNDPQVQAQHPLASVGKGWHQGNTVLIDDSVEKSRSEPYNFLEVPEFTGHKGEDPYLLKELAEYLAILRMQTNVSSYIFRNPLVRQNQLNKQEVTASALTINGQSAI